VVLLLLRFASVVERSFSEDRCGHCYRHRCKSTWFLPLIGSRMWFMYVFCWWWWNCEWRNSVSIAPSWRWIHYRPTYLYVGGRFLDHMRTHLTFNIGLRGPESSFLYFRIFYFSLSEEYMDMGVWIWDCPSRQGIYMPRRYLPKRASVGSWYGLYKCFKSDFIPRYVPEL